MCRMLRNNNGMTNNNGRGYIRDLTKKLRENIDPDVLFISLAAIAFVCFSLGGLIYLFNSEQSTDLDILTISSSLFALARFFGGTVLILFLISSYYDYEKTLLQLLQRNTLRKRLTSTEKKELWENLFAVLYSERFENLGIEVGKSLLSKFIPEQKDYYLESVDRKITILGLEKDILKIEEQTVNMYIAKDKNPISPSWKTRFNSSIGNEIIPKELVVDGKEQEEFRNISAKKFNDSEKVICYNVLLRGKKKYKVKRTVERHKNLKHDPYSKYLLTSFCKSDRISIICPENIPIELRFIPLEMPDHYNPTHNKDTPKEISRIQEDLLLPRSGYIIYYESKK